MTDSFAALPAAEAIRHLHAEACQCFQRYRGMVDDEEGEKLIKCHLARIWQTMASIWQILASIGKHIDVIWQAFGKDWRAMARMWRESVIGYWLFMESEILMAPPTLTPALSLWEKEKELIAFWADFTLSRHTSSDTLKPQLLSPCRTVSYRLRDSIKGIRLRVNV